MKVARFKNMFLVLSLLLVTTATSKAAMLMIVDPSAETFTFSGSLRGIPEFTGLISELQFGESNGGFGTISSFFALNGVLSYVPSAPTFGSFLTVDEGGSNGGISFHFTYFGTIGTEQTFTAIQPEVVTSYAGVNPVLKTVIESFAANNTVLSLTLGTSTDQATVILIPEPTGAALLLTVLGAGLACRRRSEARTE